MFRLTFAFTQVMNHSILDKSGPSNTIHYCISKRFNLSFKFINHLIGTNMLVFCDYSLLHNSDRITANGGLINTGGI